MDFIYPDLSWYSEISDQKNVSLRCPYANVHRCPRYYSSLYLLGNDGITTKMETEKIQKLNELWNKSDLLPVITEHDTSIMGSDDGVRLHNFTKYKKEWLHYQSEYRNLKM